MPVAAAASASAPAEPGVDVTAVTAAQTNGSGVLCRRSCGFPTPQSIITRL